MNVGKIRQCWGCGRGRIVSVEIPRHAKHKTSLTRPLLLCRPCRKIVAGLTQEGPPPEALPEGADFQIVRESGECAISILSDKPFRLEYYSDLAGGSYAEDSSQATLIFKEPKS